MFRSAVELKVTLKDIFLNQSLVRNASILETIALLLRTLCVVPTYVYLKVGTKA